MTVKGIRVAVLVILVLGVVTVFTGTDARACEFCFSYEEIEAPLGTEGEIGVRVVKTHNRCTMESPLDYDFDGENITITGETEWEQVDTNVFEKWLLVSLSSPGDGFLRVSCTCSKEGYQEAVLPISVIPGKGDE